MAFLSFTELKALKTGENRLMGLDLGDKVIGISLSDRLWKIAQPIGIHRRQGYLRDEDYLQKLIKKESVIALIIGLPLNMNGSEGGQANKVRQYAQYYESLNYSIFLWDERLSTLAVSRTLIEADTSRRKRSQVIDKLAAAFILQGVLDYLSFKISS